MGWITDPGAWMALVTLTALEIVLGIDNIIFISILVGHLPEGKRDIARRLGLGLAMGMRIALLLSIAWVMGLVKPLFHVLGEGFSGRDLILVGGGLFLLWKSVHEIHKSMEGPIGDHGGKAAVTTMGGVLTQIALLDVIFSLDSVITAVGMADDLPVMILAIVIAVGVMLVASKSISEFVERHPTIKMLALSFLILVGVALIADGLHFHIPKGYIYFAMAFSVVVEMLNIRARSRMAAPPPPPEPHKAPAAEEPEV